LLHTRTRMRAEPPGQGLSAEVYLYVPRGLTARFLTGGMPASKLRPHYPWAPLTDIDVAWGYLELATAIEEAHHFERRIIPSITLPREVRTFSVRLQAVRDLRNTAPTEQAHEASELAWEEGAEGLWVPSAICDGGSVLVIFPESLRPGSYFRPTTHLCVGGD
jgi:hypothetical protein